MQRGRTNLKALCTSADPQYHHRHARTDRHHRALSVPGSAAARLPVAGAAGDRDGQHRGRGSFRGYPLIIGDLYQLFDTSDLPGGVVNIVTGYAAQLLKILAEHDDVDAIWYFGDEASAAAAKACRSAI